MLLANFNRKEHLRHRAVSLRQHGFLVVHEIQSSPTSLLNFGGKLHLTDTKSELLQCLEQTGQSTHDCTVLDDAVIVHCLPTTSYSTFNEYADRGCCVGHISTRQLEGVNPRKERKGCAQESDGRFQLPGNWIDFLHDPINKRNCLPF